MPAIAWAPAAAEEAEGAETVVTETAKEGAKTDVTETAKEDAADKEKEGTEQKEGAAEQASEVEAKAGTAEKEKPQDEAASEKASEREAKEKLGQAATARFQNFAAIVQGLPVQKVEQMESYPQITASFSQVRKMATEHDLRQFEDKIDLQYMQANQLWTCCKTSLQDIRTKHICKKELGDRIRLSDKRSRCPHILLDKRSRLSDKRSSCKHIIRRSDKIIA